MYSNIGLTATRLFLNGFMRTAIIGETMNRVRNYASKNGGIIFEGGGLTGKALEWANWLWVQSNKAIGRKFVDIGFDLHRRFYLGLPPSDVYELERRWLRHYWNYWIDFVR